MWSSQPPHPQTLIIRTYAVCVSTGASLTLRCSQFQAARFRAAGSAPSVDAMATRRTHPDLGAQIEERLGVLPMGVLREVSVSRGRRRAMVAGGRWRAVPGKGVVATSGPTAGEAAWREALMAVGPGAHLGGVTALQSHGLQGYVEPRIHVWVAKGLEKQEVPGVRLHETRRWTATDAMPVGLPRSTPAVATVQAALWSVSVRQAMLCLVMPIQQRVVRAEDVQRELDRVKRHRFRRQLQAGIRDIALGAQSLNELDFTTECRKRGLPEPTRQVVRRLSHGRAVLDAYWERHHVVVEINGAGHDALDVAMRDELRITDLQVQGEAVIPLSVLTLRCDPDPFFDALERLLRTRGWCP
jgi:very-short-patch-repair endonuclease